MSIRRFFKPADALSSPKQPRLQSDSSSESDVEISAELEEEVAQSSDESEVELLSTADSLRQEFLFKAVVAFAKIVFVNVIKAVGEISFRVASWSNGMASLRQPKQRHALRFVSEA